MLVRQLHLTTVLKSIKEVWNVEQIETGVQEHFGYQQVSKISWQCKHQEQKRGTRILF